jgi:hypothetical protein
MPVNAGVELKGQCQNAPFELIRESNKTFSGHIVLKGNEPYDGAMIKLRHQQPSLWNRLRAGVQRSKQEVSSWQLRGKEFRGEQTICLNGNGNPAPSGMLRNHGKCCLDGLGAKGEMSGTSASQTVPLPRPGKPFLYNAIAMEQGSAKIS